MYHELKEYRQETDKLLASNCCSKPSRDTRRALVTTMKQTWGKGESRYAPSRHSAKEAHLKPPHRRGQWTRNLNGTLRIYDWQNTYPKPMDQTEWWEVTMIGGHQGGAWRNRYVWTSSSLVCTKIRIQWKKTWSCWTTDLLKIKSQDRFHLC